MEQPFATERQLRIASLLQAISSRRRESVNLYVPRPAAVDFHACTAPIRILDGANQSGKTLAAKIEFARAVTGRDPYNKYPKHGGVAQVVAYDREHLADPIWRGLSEEGAFEIIRDEITGLWRPVRPDPANPSQLDPYDLAYREKWRPAPPLIEPKWITKISWEKSSLGVPAMVELITDWRVYFRSSKSKPPRGRQYDVWWFDEEVENDQFLAESVRGAMRRSGRGFWSATAQSGGAQLWNLRRQADAGAPHVRAFTLGLLDCPYIPDDQKAVFSASLSSDEERAVRIHGLYSRAGLRVYPSFEPTGAHGCDAFSVPVEYTRYVVVDPGHRYCGTLIGAIDPDEIHAYVVDAFVLNGCDADEWARQLMGRIGSTPIYAIIMDERMGGQHLVARARKVANYYWEALERLNVRPVSVGPMSGFFPGCSDVRAREEALREWMRYRIEPQYKGTARLQVMVSRCSELIEQIESAVYDSRRPDRRVPLVGHDDLVTCLEYWAASRPAYSAVPMPEEKNRERAVFEAAWERKRQRTKTYLEGTTVELG